MHSMRLIQVSLLEKVFGRCYFFQGTTNLSAQVGFTLINLTNPL